MLLEPPVWGPVGHVYPVGRAATTGEQSNDAASPIEYDGAGISWSGEGPTLPVVGQYGGLGIRVLDAVVGVDASERVEPVDVNYGSARGQAALQYLATDVKVLGLADFVDVDLVSREGVPVNLLIVKLNKGPIARKPVEFV